jgi:hypothetical protein
MQMKAEMGRTSHDRISSSSTSVLARTLSSVRSLSAGGYRTAVQMLGGSSNAGSTNNIRSSAGLTRGGSGSSLAGARSTSPGSSAAHYRSTTHGSSSSNSGNKSRRRTAGQEREPQPYMTMSVQGGSGAAGGWTIPVAAQLAGEVDHYGVDPMLTPQPSLLCSVASGSVKSDDTAYRAAQVQSRLHVSPWSSGQQQHQPTIAGSVMRSLREERRRTTGNGAGSKGGAGDQQKQQQQQDAAAGGGLGGEVQLAGGNNREGNSLESSMRPGEDCCATCKR